MPKFNELGEVVFKGDDPDYVADYGFKGKGLWLLVAVGPGDRDKAAFGPFPSDEDAVEFGHHMLSADHLHWGVSMLIDPRDLTATGAALNELGALKITLIQPAPPEEPTG